jgi:uncharacterized protein involved in exopolysaccharide biosynthesis
MVYASVSGLESNNLLPLLELLWEKRAGLLRWILAGVVLAVVLRFGLPAKYESTARILPSGSSSETAMMMAGSGAGGLVAPNLGTVSDLFGMKTPGALCAALLRSDTVLDGVVNRQGLRQVYQASDDDAARKSLSNRTVIVDDKKSGMVSLSATDTDPRRAAAIANAFTEELDKVLQTLNTSAAHREREFLEQRIAVVRQNLGAAEQRLGQFSSQNSTLDVKEQGKAAVEVASWVEGELIVAQSELQGLRQIYGPDHPRVKATQARVSQLRAAAAQLGAATTQSTELPFLSISRLPLVGVTYADLFREVKVEEAIYESLLKQYEISKVEEVKQTPRLRVIDYGKVPSRRSSPRLSVLGLFCIFGCFLAGVVAILARAKWDDADPGSPWKRLGIRVAGDLRQTAGHIAHRTSAYAR